MEFLYRVHGVNWSPCESDVTLQSGETVKGVVQTLFVELVPSDHEGGTTSFKFVGEQAAKVAADIKKDDIVSLVLAKVVK